MGRLLNIVTPLHKATKRDYLARMVDDKVHCMLKAKEYEVDYWDGDRRYGYGGYKYLRPLEARGQALIDTYGLKAGSQGPRCRLRQGVSAPRNAIDRCPGLELRRLRHFPARPGDRRTRISRALCSRYRAQDRIRSATSSSTW